MTRPLALAALAVVLFSCGGRATRAVRIGAVMQARDRDCELRLYPPGEHPKRAVVLGRVEAEGNRRATLEGLLRAEACGLGADAIMDVTLSEFAGSRASFDENRDVVLVDEGTVYTAQAFAVLLRDPTPVRPPPPPAPVVAPPPAPVPCTPSPAAPEAPAKPVAAPPPPTRTPPEPDLLDTLLPPPFDPVPDAP